MSDETDDERVPGEVPRVGALCVVLALLLALTASTTALAFVEMPPAAHAAVALAIAAGKAGLVAAYFMHLAHEERLIRAAAVAALIWLAILLFVLVDVALRAGGS